MSEPMSSLRITEIFCSIQGESTTAGEPTVFVRLTGCPLRCHYCDTAYAFTGGKKVAISDIVEQVAAFDVEFVTVTGGEPLAQKECFVLLTALCDAGFDQSTLFRCLNELADAGLVARLDLGDQVRRFELSGPEGAGAAEHAHFMCVDCGMLTCMEGFSIRLTPERGARRKALGVITEVLLRGHCGKCANPA